MLAKLPPKASKNSRRAYELREFPQHRAWVRSHACCVPGCEPNPMIPLTMSRDAAHVRRNTDGGTSLKPHDKWCISLCKHHHAEQHRADLTFERRYNIDTRELALLFAAQSPHRHKWADPS